MKDLSTYILERFTVAGTESNKILFFDDNEENLRTAKKLEDKYDIKIHIVKA